MNLWFILLFVEWSHFSNFSIFSNSDNRRRYINWKMNKSVWSRLASDMAFECNRYFTSTVSMFWVHAFIARDLCASSSSQFPHSIIHLEITHQMDIIISAINCRFIYDVHLFVFQALMSTLQSAPIHQGVSFETGSSFIFRNVVPFFVGEFRKCSYLREESCIGRPVDVREFYICYE